MNVGVERISHGARSDMFQREAIWRLGPEALEREGGEPADAPWWGHLARFYLRLIIPWAVRGIEQGGSAGFPYALMSDIRLCFDPNRADDIRYRCDRGSWTASFYSTHYVSVAQFEDRATAYVPLVRGLVARAAAANPACRFHSGKRPWTYWTTHVFLLIMLLLLVLVFGLVGEVAFNDLVLVKLGIVAAYIPVMIIYSRKNWPRRFDPAAIPADVLPGGSCAAER